MRSFARFRFVLTDMDETPTHHGRLSATYDALERLQANGVKVIPVTAAGEGSQPEFQLSVNARTVYLCHGKMIVCRARNRQARQ